MSRFTLHLCACLLAAAAASLVGCRNDRRALPKPEPGYAGPTDSMGAVVAAINENNQKLPTLWMRHDFQADIVEVVDGRKRKTSVNGDGAILYRSPTDLLFTGNKAGAGTIFQIGANAERYWLSIPFESVSTMWWGRFEHLGKPCAKPIPIRPDLLLEVLGVFTFDPNFTRMPAPTMKFDSAGDSYVFTWIAPAPQRDRYIALKEVWYDRRSKRPTRVLLFDEDGRTLLRAVLTGHTPVEVPGEPRERWPVVAKGYDLLFPDTGTRMEIDVQNAQLQYRSNPRSPLVPNENSFRFPARPQVAKVEQLDEACGP